MGSDIIRVIIAEDHALVREGTRQLIEREPDIEVVGEATNGAEAVALVDQLSPDVAIVDISMPVMSGIEATERIKSTHPATAVLVLTAYDDDQYVFALLQAGAAGYLLKDVDSSEVIRAIRSVHTGEPVLHPAIARKILARFSAEHVALGMVPTVPFGRPEPQRKTAMTDREMEVLRLAASGLTNMEIAQRLQFSVRTVQVHMTHIFSKLGVGSRTEAVITSLRQGIISLQSLQES